MDDESPSDGRTDPTDPAFERLVDWVVGAFLCVGGVLIALGGAALSLGVSRADVTEVVYSPEFEVEGLTRAEAVDLLVALADWGGIGLVAAGLLLVALGVAVVVGHGRARREGRPTPRWVLGVVGAIVGSVLSFVPLSPLAGGAAAGYLDPDPTRSGLGAGLLAGLFASLPPLVVAVFVAVGLFVGFPGEAATAVVVLVGVGLVFSLFYLVGLSAVGGYVGGWLRED